MTFHLTFQVVDATQVISHTTEERVKLRYLRWSTDAIANRQDYMHVVLKTKHMPPLRNKFGRTI